MGYWLLKSEPDTFSIDDLYSLPNRTDHWDGIRNYQARNFMRDEMKKGDLAFFYHSNCAEPAIVGLVEVIKEAYVDHTAFDPDEYYFDAKSDPERPRWVMVDVKFKQKFRNVVTLQDMKANPLLSEMRLVQKGNRLSIMPISSGEWIKILEMNGESVS
jgi:predicted RNA-binding protein with PUA-like domain